MRDRRDNEHPGWVAGKKWNFIYSCVFVGAGHHCDWQSLFMFNLYVKLDMYEVLYVIDIWQT